MPRELLANDYRTTLSAALLAGDGTLALTDLPPAALRDADAGWYRLLIYDAGGTYANRELVLVQASANGANPQTILKRGVEAPASVALDHAAGSIVEAAPTVAALCHAFAQGLIGVGVGTPLERAIKAWSHDPWPHVTVETRPDTGRVYVTRIPIYSLEQLPLSGYLDSLYRAGSGIVNGQNLVGLYELEADGVTLTKIRELDTGTTWASTGLKTQTWGAALNGGTPWTPGAGQLPRWGAVWLAKLYNATTRPAPLGWVSMPSEHLSYKARVPTTAVGNARRFLPDFYIPGSEPRSVLPASFSIVDAIAQHFTTAWGALI